jgi:hypothetical protein
MTSNPTVPLPPPTSAANLIITHSTSTSQNSSSTSSALIPHAEQNQLTQDDSSILSSIVNSTPLDFTFTNLGRAVRGVWNRIRMSEVETVKAEAASFTKTPDLLGSERTQLDIHRKREDGRIYMESVAVRRSRRVAARNLLTAGDGGRMIKAAPVSMGTTEG